VLFVPIVGGFFPFGLDFVRSAGLLVALGSAIAAGPHLLRGGLADLRLSLPLALIASISSIAGALLGLALPAFAMQIALGIMILGIVALTALNKSAELPAIPDHSRSPARLRIGGTFFDAASNANVSWRVHRFGAGMALFAVNGLFGGMFGVGAGWANVPALNLVMGAPVKIAAGSSSLILSLASSSAIWTYVNAGAVLPMIAAPAMIGMMLGARIGAHLLAVLKPSIIRRMVIVLLLFAGVRSLLKGLGIWV
jgi:uncharacterized membrane protein YfcA